MGSHKYVINDRFIPTVSIITDSFHYYYTAGNLGKYSKSKHNNIVGDVKEINMWSSAQLPVVAVIVGVSALVMMVRMAALYYSCFILFGFLPHPFRSKKTWRVYDDIVDNTLSRMSHDLELLTELERVLSRKQERTGVKKYNLSLLQLEIKITQARLARVQRIAEQCGYVVRESKAESMPQVG